MTPGYRSHPWRSGPGLADETTPPDLDEISGEIHAFGRGRLPDWETGYLEYHRRRYQDTLRLLPAGEGRRLWTSGRSRGISRRSRARAAGTSSG